jgi:hypothetical protein
MHLELGRSSSIQSAEECQELLVAVTMVELGHHFTGEDLEGSEHFDGAIPLVSVGPSRCEVGPVGRTVCFRSCPCI